MDGLPIDLLALCLAAFLAGLMDAVVGGGGSPAGGGIQWQ